MSVTATGWYVLRRTVGGEHRTGPWTWAQIVEMARAGALLPTDLLWHAALPHWQAAASLLGSFTAAPPTAAGTGRKRSAVPLVLLASAGVVAVAAIVVGVLALVRWESGAGSANAAGAGSGVEGLVDPTELTPPLLEEGEVPPSEESEVSSPAETAPLIGHLTLAAPTPMATKRIGAAGGTLEAQGLKLEIPQGALAGDATFDVKQATIVENGFRELVTPLTPLYLVDDGGAALGAPVTVTLPATIPAGAIAMAFSYDDATGTLTPLIPISQDAGAITAGATHFSGILGGLLDLAKVPTTVDSGFRPGVDDWQFVNYGSYVAPRGQCEGQSVSAMWYYVNQRRKAGASPLNGLYDNNGAPTKTPTFWQDDSDAYRFVGSVHADPIAVPFTYRFLRDSMWNSAEGRITYEAFGAAIALSKQPQLIRISPAPNDPGHTMIVYRVTPHWLLIADPNYPDRHRGIRYDAATGKLGSYSSGANAADIAEHGATVYTRFAYVPAQSSKSDASVAAHWADFEAGTAGDGRFPRFVLEALAGKDAAGQDVWAPLDDGYQTEGKKITIRLRDPHARDATRLSVYRDTSSRLAAPAGRQVTIDLKEGENPLGILEQGAKRGWTEWQYVDFVRLTITSGESTGWARVDVRQTPMSLARVYRLR